MKLFNTYKNRIIFLQLFLCGLFFSCSNEETAVTDEPTPIVFSAHQLPVTANQESSTRADVDNENPAMENLDDVIASKENVLIYGLRYGSTDNPNWGSPTQQKIMEGVRGSVQKRAANDYWINYSPIQYYELGSIGKYKYDFKFVFPAPSDQGDDSSGVTFLSPSDPYKLRVNLYRRPDLLKGNITGIERTSATPKPQLEANMEHLLTSVVLKIVKADASLKQNIYINHFTVSGVIRGTYDVINEKFETPVKQHLDPNMVDAITGASILVPGYNTDDDFLVPDYDQTPKRIRELFLFPVKGSASEDTDDLERYFFDILLNERKYTFKLPVSTEANWEGWKPGERYTYTLKVGESDIYIEPNEIIREQWKPEPVEKEEIGGE